MLPYSYIYYQAQFEAEREGWAFSRWIVWLDKDGNRLLNEDHGG
jgi:hypothetical protein